MSAERLREAAKALRDDAASKDAPIAAFARVSAVAIIQPTFALAVADWLDATASIWLLVEASGDNPLRPDDLPFKVDGVASAIAVADAILGGA